MTRLTRIIRFAPVAALSVALAAGAAHADRADQLFDRGKKLLAEKRYAEACKAFQDSDALDPGIGAKVNVARCYQAWGKLATAWRWFSDAEAMAAKAKDDRLPKIQAMLRDVDGNVPRLTLKLPAGAAPGGVTIKLDGDAFAIEQLGREQRVDPGPHTIEYTVEGTVRTKVVPLERGSSSEVTLEGAGKIEPVAPVIVRDDGRPRRLLGLGVAGGGVLALGVAGVVTWRAHSDYEHALSAHCRDDHRMCDAIGERAASNARKRANIATAITIGGVAAVAAGVYFYLTAPSAPHRDEHAFYVAPAVDDAGGGLVFGGAF